MITVLTDKDLRINGDISLNGFDIPRSTIEQSDIIVYIDVHKELTFIKNRFKTVEALDRLNGLGFNVNMKLTYHLTS